MTRPTQLLLSLTTLLIAAACGKSGSPNGAGGTVSQAKALDDKPIGVFTAAGTPSVTPLAGHYAAPACDAGQTRGAAKIDLRLQPGDRFATTTQISQPGGNVSVDFVETIQSVSTDTLVASMEYANLSVQGKEFPNLGAVTKTCRQTEDADKSVKIECRIGAGETKNDGESADESCWLATAAEKTASEFSESAGTFRMANGTEVKAFKDTVINRGEIRCKTGKGPEISRGHGKSVTILIASNEVLADDQIRCGGESLFTYGLITDDAGRVYSSVRVEVTAAGKAR